MANGILGLSSGLPLDQLVSDLTNALYSPKFEELNTREISVQSEISAFATLESAMDELFTAVKVLDDSATYQSKIAVSQASSIFTASADDTAVLGSYEIEVTSLAQANKLRSNPTLIPSSTSTVGTGTLSISVGTGSFDVAIDGTNDTLEGIRDAINNASDNSIITATILNVDDGSELILTAVNTGLTNTITVSVDDDDLTDTNTSGLSILDSGNLTELDPAQDATLEIETQVATSSTNVFSDVIDGFTITANKVTDPVDTTDTLEISLKTSTATDAINTLIEKYNDVQALITSLMDYNVETNVAGPLLGNGLVRGIENQLRSIIGGEVEGITTDFTRVSEIGFETQLDGTINIDESILNDAIANNIESVEALFASTNGIAIQLNNALDSYLQINGIIDSTQETLDEKLANFNTERTELTRKSDDYFEFLNERFTTLELQLSQFQAQSDFLTNALSNLPGFTFNND